MFDMASLTIFVLAALALLLMPGPAVLYIVARSIDQGRMAGIVSGDIDGGRRAAVRVDGNFIMNRVLAVIYIRDKVGIEFCFADDLYIFVFFTNMIKSNSEGIDCYVF